MLIAIARKARERLAVEGKVPNSIPNRVLVPFMEKASLSDLEDEVLTSAWSNVLAAATRFLSTFLENWIPLTYNFFLLSPSPKNWNLQKTDF